MTLLLKTTDTSTGTLQSRDSLRTMLSLGCEVRQGTRAWQRAFLEDLSPTGFRISGLAHPDPIKLLSIRIPGMQLLSARIRWNNGVLAGCKFIAPLHVAVFDHLVRQIKPLG